MSHARRILQVVLVAFGPALLSGPTIALAQPMREAVVVPLGASEVSPALDATAAVEVALANAHVSVISLHDAQDRFTARSRPPQQLTESDLEALSRAAHEAIEHVAFGRTASAQKSVRDVIARAERALESLNRETATARQILDACLSLVRSTLQTGSREQALEQAMRCRQLVPDLVPSRTSQPANVIGVLVEADDLLARMRIGHLQVQSTPAPHCAVYLNGRHLGSTPFELDRAAAGVYRVQVECGKTPGRVHLVQLGDEPANLLVDTELDRAVASDPRLSLRYDDSRKARAYAVAGAVSLGRDVGADDVVLVAVDQATVELSRVQVRQQRMVGRAALPRNDRRGLDAGALERAIAALAEARIEGKPSLDPNGALSSGTTARLQGTEALAQARAAHTVSTQAAPRPNERRVDDESSHRPLDERTGGGSPSSPSGENRLGRRWKLALGVTTLVVGAGLFGVAGALAAQRREAGDALRALPTGYGVAYTARVAEWEDTRLGPYISASLGSAVLTGSALGLLLTSRRKAFPPWASVATGLVGLGLTTWGVADLVRGDACDTGELDRRRCSDELERRDRGAIVMLAAAPALILSLTQLLRAASAASPAPTALIYPEVRLLQRTVSVTASVRGL